MDRSRFVLVVAALSALFIPASVSAETRESYLQRLRDICAADCMEPRHLLRAARKNGRDATQDVAAILDIASVSVWNGKYMLHASLADWAFDPMLGSQTPLTSRPVFGPNIIVVEMDEETFFNLLNVPTPREQALANAEARKSDGIIVERDRSRNLTKPTLATLRSMFRNRRIVVRGQPRLEVAFVGGRRDYRQKKLFIVLDDARELALLPRYDKNGEPILDGSLEGLRDDYQPAGK